MHRIRRDERGFTLIELLMVVLVIAVLIAVAIPTFTGARDAANDRAVQSDLRNGMLAAKTIAAASSPALFQVAGVDLTPAELEAVEPSLDFDVVAAASSSVIGVDVEVGGARVTLVERSATSTWFGISATARGVITYCEGDVVADCDDGGTDAFTAASW